jgi:hypothetical protein
MRTGQKESPLVAISPASGRGRGIEGAHDLRMRRVGGKRVYAWPVTQAGGVDDETFKLLPGRYVLYCGVANHRALGMQAVLLVRH